MQRARLYGTWGLCAITVAAVVGVGNGPNKEPVAMNSEYNVRQFGAAGDGRTKDTAAINKAVESCAAAGGGTVYVPAGRYLTGTISLRSNVTLHVAAGATILGSPDLDDYPIVEGPWAPYEPAPDASTAQQRSRVIASLIHGRDLVNVAITGRGTIDGGGQPWWERQRLSRRLAEEGLKEPAPGREDEFREAQKVRFGRPRLIELVGCKSVLIQGVTLTNSASWTVHPIFCEQVTVEGITIVNPPDSPNTDGVNPESCSNVHIANCHIDVGDDCVTIKSGKDETGRRAARPCENITVTNCTMIHGHGGVVIGSEMSGGARNIAIANCVFRQTDRGIRLKTLRGRGGIVEDIAVSNIVMQDVVEAFTMDMYYGGADPEAAAEPVTERTPQFRNLMFSNITARGVTRAGRIRGLREMPIAGIAFSNVRLAARSGLECSNIADLAFHNVRIDTEEGPGLACRDVRNLQLDGLETTKPHPEAPVVDLTDVRRAFIRGCWASPGTATFVRISGAATEDIVLSGNNLAEAKTAVAVGDEVRKAAVVQR